LPVPKKKREKKERRGERGKEEGLRSINLFKNSRCSSFIL
jgi:hypothetical protein